MFSIPPAISTDNLSRIFFFPTCDTDCFPALFGSESYIFLEVVVHGGNLVCTLLYSLPTICTDAVPNAMWIMLTRVMLRTKETFLTPTVFLFVVHRGNLVCTLL